MNIIQLELKLVHATWDENEQQIGRQPSSLSMFVNSPFFLKSD